MYLCHLYKMDVTLWCCYCIAVFITGSDLVAEQRKAPLPL